MNGVIITTKIAEIMHKSHVGSSKQNFVNFFKLFTIFCLGVLYDTAVGESKCSFIIFSKEKACDRVYHRLFEDARA